VKECEEGREGGGRERTTGGRDRGEEEGLSLGVAEREGG
jgi:hypothetical protein